jgi:MFS family permease
MIVLADISTPSDRGRIMSLYQGSLLLGAGAGPALGGIVAGLWGYAVPFLIFGGLTFVAAVWALVQMPETRDLAMAGSATAPPAASAGDSDVATAPTARRPAAPSLGAVLRLLLTDRSFLLVSGVTLTTFLTRTGGQMTLLPLLGHERLGMSEAAIGGVFTLIAVVNFATLYVAGALADRFGRKAVIVPAGVLTAVAIGLYGFAASTSGFVFVSVLLGVGIGLAGPAPAAYATDIMPAGAIGPGMGLYRTISDLGFVLGPIALGAVVDARGYGLAFGLNAAMMLMTTLPFAAWAHETAGTAAPHDAAAPSRH